MPGLCANCGAPVGAAAFCPGCGLALGTQTKGRASSAAAASAPASGGLSALAKLAIAAVLVFGVLGVGTVAAMIYVAHRVKQEIHEAGGKLQGSLGSRPGSGPSRAPGLGSSGSSHEDVCAYLSKEEVGRAIGVDIVATESKEHTCSYLAVGDQAGMTARHVAALGASHGANDQAQKAVEGFASAIFHAAQAQRHDSGADASGRVPVLVVAIEDGAEEQMRLDHGVLGRFPGSQDLPGIGDEAFDTGNAMLMVRKGSRMLQITYMTCPCGLEAIKPLARKLASAI